jgi:hypothetical protein
VGCHNRVTPVFRLRNWQITACVQAQPFDPETDDLPIDLVRDLLLPRYVEKQARLGAAIYSSVGWRQGSYAYSVTAPPADDVSNFAAISRGGNGRRDAKARASIARA